MSTNRYKLCRQCGYVSPNPDARFCGKCGSIFVEKKRTSISGKRALVIGAGVLVGVGILIVIANDVSTPPAPSTQAEKWQTKDLKQCQAFGAMVTNEGIIQDAIAAKTTGIDKQVELEHLTERIKNLGSEVALTPPKTAKDYADLIVFSSWYTTDTSYNTETAIVGYCEWIVPADIDK
jgi:hypothetical protein